MCLRVNSILYRSKIRGAILLDSLLALTLFGSFLLWLTLFNQNNQRAKNAKILTTQTEAMAQVFAKYLDINTRDLLKQIPRGGSYTLSVQLLGEYWPMDLASTNMYGQIPCVTVIRNITSGNLEALMYYVDGTIDSSKIRAVIMNDAAVLLGNKGGVLDNNEIKGNSGWNISTNILPDISQCGAKLAIPSIVVNLDLLVDWNQHLQPNISITKAQDFGDPEDIRTLPGHVLNTNTAKANINFTTNAGVILDGSNTANLVKLQINHTRHVATFGDNNITTLIADTIKPLQIGRFGDACLVEEIGKTITDQGRGTTEIAHYLVRNTLTCTQNAMLCNNSTQTCYLPSITNSIIFQNNDIGIQDLNKQFICPAEIPFASSVVTSSGGGSSSTQAIQQILAGYIVIVGYRLIVPNAVINRVTCSNMPIYYSYS